MLCGSNERRTNACQTTGDLLLCQDRLHIPGYTPCDSHHRSGTKECSHYRQLLAKPSRWRSSSRLSRPSPLLYARSLTPMPRPLLPLPKRTPGKADQWRQLTIGCQHCHGRNINHSAVSRSLLRQTAILHKVDVVVVNEPHFHTLPPG